VLTIIAIVLLALAGRNRQGVELAAQHEKELEAAPKDCLGFHVMPFFLPRSAVLNA